MKKIQLKPMKGNSRNVATVTPPYEVIGSKRRYGAQSMVHVGKEAHS